MTKKLRRGDSVEAIKGKTNMGSLKGETGVISMIDGKKALVEFDNPVYYRRAYGDIDGAPVPASIYWCKLEWLKHSSCNHSCVCTRCGKAMGRE